MYRRSLFLSALLSAIAIGCGNKGSGSATTPSTSSQSGGGTGKVEPAVQETGGLDKLLADLKSSLPGRRVGAPDQAKRLDAEGVDVATKLIGVLKDSSAGVLGNTSESTPDSTREAAVLSLIKLGEKGKKALLADGVKTLLDGLRDAKPNVREHTANAIGMIGPDAAKLAGDALVKLCADKEPLVRSAAYRALERLKTVPVDGILRLLKHADAEVCVDAAQNLTWLKPQGDSAVDLLLEAIKSEHLEKSGKVNEATLVRFAAAEALGETGKAAEKAIPELIAFVQRTDIEKLEAFLRPKEPGSGRMTVPGPVAALQKIGKPALEPLKPLLKHDQPAVRYQAIMAVSGMGKQAAEALPEILGALENELTSGSAQLVIFEELGQAAINLGADPAKVMGPISALFKNENFAIRARAAFLTGRLGRAAAIVSLNDLTDLLKDQVAQVQATAALAIAKAGPAAKGAVEPLAKLVASETPAVSRAAVEALTAIGPASAPAVDPLTKLLDSPNNNVLIEACRALSAIGPEAAPAVDELLKQLSKSDNRAPERNAMLAVLAGIGDKAKKSSSVVVKLVNDKDVTTRIAAISALSKIDPTGADVVKKLGAATSDSQGSVRIAALRSLSVIGTAAKPALADVKAMADKTTDPVLKVWAAAVHMSAGVDTDANLKVVQAALKERSPTARAARSAALQTLPALGAKGRTLISELNDALKDKTPVPTRSTELPIRAVAAETAAELGTAAKTTLPALIDLLRDTDKSIRVRAAKALEKLGTDAILAIPKLRDLLTDDQTADAAQAAIDAIQPPAPKKDGD